jgi:hypothetical protein
VVKATTKRGRWQTPPPEPVGPPLPANDDGKPAPPPAAEQKPAIVTTASRRHAKLAQRIYQPTTDAEAAPAAQSDNATASPPPAADRKSAIVTIRRPSRFGTAEDITAEERNRRADLADALMQDFKRQIIEKLKERKP